METKFNCSQCKTDKSYISDITTGYGTDKEGNKICFDCCRDNDINSLVNLQPKQKFCLYYDGLHITNWPGTLKLKSNRITKGKHNFCRTRTDVYFTLDKYNFHGVQMGDWNQILHINKVKQ